MRDDVSADDALQDAFVKILRHGGAYRMVDNKLRWLYRVVDHCCFDARKRRLERPAAPVELECPGPDPQSALASRIAARRALHRLAPGARLLAVLALVDGRSQDEIGTEVGVSRQTVNKKLRAIRRRLAASLGDMASSAE
jgi:RNA polymerase sigma factor (sigma-70 family)